jgi:hypothetical protein
MMPTIVAEQAPVPPPAYHHAQGRLGPALHIDALTLVRTLHVLTLCHRWSGCSIRRTPRVDPLSQACPRSLLGGFMS